jgi:hypothetical protein
MENRRYPRYALSVPVMLTGNSGTRSSVAAEMIDLSAGVGGRMLLPRTAGR